MRRLLALSYFAIFGFAFSLNAQENKISPAEHSYQKVYVSLDQLHIDSSGIFVNLADNIVQTNAIYHDSTGMFILTNSQKDEYCPNGHRSPDNDGRCAVSKCRYYKYPNRFQN